MIRFLALIFALIALPVAATAAPVRIGVVTDKATGCDQSLAKTLGGEAFAKHLQKRLNRPIILCGFANRAAAMQALAAGKIELSPSDQRISTRASASVGSKAATAGVPLVAKAKASGASRCIAI